MTCEKRPGYAGSAAPRTQTRTALLFADDLLARMGLDYKMKQVMANGIMNLVKTWSLDKDLEDYLEWWVKEPFTLFQPFNTIWPEWFVKEIESNTKV